MNELQVTTNELWTHEWKFMWMNSIHHITMSNIDINDKFRQWLCDETRWLCITWTSVCLVAEGHCEVPRGCLYFYSLFFTAMDTLPCPVSMLPFVASDRRRKLHRERAVFFFPFAARDTRRKLHRELFFFFFPRGRFCAFGFRDSWRWSQVRRFACGRDGWNVRPVGWMTVRAGGVRGCFTKSLHI